MRLLLDTHALLWWTSNSPELSDSARDAINSMDKQIFVSAAFGLGDHHQGTVGKIARRGGAGR